MTYTEYRLSSFTTDAVREELADRVSTLYPDIERALRENRPLMVSDTVKKSFLALCRDMSLPYVRRAKRFGRELPEAVKIKELSDYTPMYAVYWPNVDRAPPTLYPWLCSTMKLPRLADVVRCRGIIMVAKELEEDFLKLELPYWKKGDYTKRNLPVKNFLFEVLE